MDSTPWLIRLMPAFGAAGALVIQLAHRRLIENDRELSHLSLLFVALAVLTAVCTSISLHRKRARVAATMATAGAIGGAVLVGSAVKLFSIGGNLFPLVAALDLATASASVLVGICAALLIRLITRLVVKPKRVEERAEV